MPYDPMMSNIDNRIMELEEELELLTKFANFTMRLKDTEVLARLVADKKNDIEKWKYDKLRHQNHNKERGIKY